MYVAFLIKASSLAVHAVCMHAALLFVCWTTWLNRLAEHSALLLAKMVTRAVYS
jgi:hypothetical protein